MVEHILNWRGSHASARGANLNGVEAYLQYYFIVPVFFAWNWGGGGGSPQAPSSSVTALKSICKSWERTDITRLKQELERTKIYYQSPACLVGSSSTILSEGPLSDQKYQLEYLSFEQRNIHVLNFLILITRKTRETVIVREIILINIWFTVYLI